MTPLNSICFIILCWQPQQYTVLKSVYLQMFIILDYGPLKVSSMVFQIFFLHSILICIEHSTFIFEFFFSSFNLNRTCPVVIFVPTVSANATCIVSVFHLGTFFWIRFMTWDSNENNSANDFNQTKSNIIITPKQISKVYKHWTSLSPSNIL